MQTVTVKKADLMAIIQKNRAEHREIVDEAFKNYREQAIKELDSMIAEARAGKRIRRMLALVEPMDQTRDYDNAIKKLEMSVEDNIELTDRDFRCLVMNQWEWKQQFSASNSSYSLKATDY